ncbi:MAG: hypothetical protein WCO56_16175 [Verrucomicrobiota bacterium]
MLKIKTAVIIFTVLLILAGVCFEHWRVATIIPTERFEEAWPFKKAEHEFKLDLARVQTAVACAVTNGEKRIVIISRYRIPYYRLESKSLAVLDPYSKPPEGCVFIYDQNKIKNHYACEITGPKFVFLEEPRHSTNY